MKPVDIVEKRTQRRDLPPFRAGDTVRVHVRIREGDKTRTQVFEGVVIRRRGAGSSESFTVRKVTYGVGVERVFPVQAPAVEKVEIRSRGHVRRSRLYYLRGRRGKKARLPSKVRDLSHLVSEEEAERKRGGPPGKAAEAVDSEAAAPEPEAEEKTAEASGSKSS